MSSLFETIRRSVKPDTSRSVIKILDMQLKITNITPLVGTVEVIMLDQIKSAKSILITLCASWILTEEIE